VISGEALQRARILIVDDSTVMTMLLAQMLRAAGYSDVTTTHDPCTVEAMHATHQFDLILLDIMMPKLDGFAVLARLVAMDSDGYVPVIVLTGQPSHRLRALQGGARDFISKPFDQSEALARIRNAIEARLLLQESRSYGVLLEQYDQLTGLANRRRFRELLERALASAAASAGAVGVVFVSLDRFKAVSDVLGRRSGGALLVAAAARLEHAVDAPHTVARLEGAEFGVLVLGDGVTVARVVATVHATFLAPFPIDGHELAVRTSIGVASAPDDATDADSLLSFAARAESDAHSAGGDRVHYHCALTNQRAAVALSLEAALYGALERQEFFLHYQPKMNVASGQWSSVEALLRWQQPGVGLVSPAEFIPVLESTGLIVPVGRWVLRAVCAQIADWAARGLRHVRVAVNVSSQQFTRPDFVDDVRAALADSGIAAAALDLEITESALMSRDANVAAALNALKALGVRIAIDDFGTGYSSLSYLTRYPIDTLKIDISFIREITPNAEGSALTAAIIGLARTLKMNVIAEGVETVEQLAFLRAHSCDEIQGYLFSPPLTAEELMRRMA
jgi:diguanylate cyclase (GGDEF)-like protein